MKRRKEMVDGFLFPKWVWCVTVIVVFFAIMFILGVSRNVEMQRLEEAVEYEVLHIEYVTTKPYIRIWLRGDSAGDGEYAVHPGQIYDFFFVVVDPADQVGSSATTRIVGRKTEIRLSERSLERLLETGSVSFIDSSPSPSPTPTY